MSPEDEENRRRLKINHGRSDFPISDGVRNAIEESGQTQYRIAKLSGVSAAQISRFYGEHRDLSVKTLDRIAVVLRLKLLFRRYRNPSNPKLIYGVGIGPYGAMRSLRKSDHWSW